MLLRVPLLHHAVGHDQTQCWQVGFSSILEEDFGAPEFFSDEIFRPGDKKVNYNNIRSATCSVFVVPTSPWLREGGTVSRRNSARSANGAKAACTSTA
jgi:hypothetical protein